MTLAKGSPNGKQPGNKHVSGGTQVSLGSGQIGQKEGNAKKPKSQEEKLRENDKETTWT